MTAPPASALAVALLAEHATVYGYGVVAAFVDDAVAAAVSAAAGAHRDRRDATAALLGGGAPVAAAGYEVPVAVDDPGTALELALLLEERTARAWHGVLADGEPGEARGVALDALTQDALRARAWRTALGATPTTTAFPGQPQS